MRLYHHPFSANSRRALVTALQLGADVEVTVVDLAKGAQRAPKFLALNPNGRVPVLEDGDFVLWESHAIMLYLAEATPGQTLYPAERRARADVNRWLFWNAHHFAPSVGILNWERMVKKLVGLGAPEPVLEKKGEAQVADCAKVLDQHLASRTWVSGKELTLADLAIATPLLAIGPARLQVKEYANIMAWFSRVQELDAWKKAAPAM